MLNLACRQCCVLLLSSWRNCTELCNLSTCPSAQLGSPSEQDPCFLSRGAVLAVHSQRTHSGNDCAQGSCQALSAPGRILRADKI